ncbi:MAG: MurR/RpiR family transcriptional regulator [Lachnospiraceae bacterium]|nr:MurR/RpiR family transcriptional regulator [Lachnospiraceae bacterium]
MQKGYEGKTMQVIDDKIHSFTSMEQRIADYFRKMPDEKADLSARKVAADLFVSEAALSRFAKKCGYKGYREFIFEYRREQDQDLAKEHLSRMTRRVRDTYDMLMEENFRNLDEKVIRHAASMMESHKRVLVCGMGSSGCAALEFQMRFLCLGMDITAVTDSQMIRISSAMMDPDSLLIAITLSGQTPEILQAIEDAKQAGAQILLITSDKKVKGKELCDDIIYVTATQEQAGGTDVSPQFPILVIADILYSYYLESDEERKMANYRMAAAAIRRPGAKTKGKK